MTSDSISNTLAVGCGGTLGALMRYYSVVFLAQKPLIAISLANLIAALTLGYLHSQAALHPTSALLLSTGLCGSLSTFSTFVQQAWHSWQQTPWHSLLYLIVNLAGSALAYSLMISLFKNLESIL